MTGADGGQPTEPGEITAPLYDDVADGPSGGRAFWTQTSDRLRLRVALWPAGGPARGTVLLFPGRTEYVEKYGRLARDLAARGFATLAIDWRGQGLSPRLLDDPLGGHVLAFADYQRDVAAILGAASNLGVPRPLHLLAHSMGGAIGLRSLVNGLPVATATFTAPMWGIRLSAAVRPLAWSLAWAARAAGIDHRYAPGTSRRTYTATAVFESNLLTTDRVQFSWMVHQIQRHPGLALGGPSLRWLGEALTETRALARLSSPLVPTLTLLGSDEAVVDPARITARMAVWSGGRLERIAGARHEVMMEAPALRDRAIAAMMEHILAHG